MPWHRMSEDEWRSFLGSPVRPALLATTRKDGSPHVAPIWYDLDDEGRIVFNTGVNSAKGHAIRRDGRAALCVQDDQPPFSYVMITGPVDWSEDPDDLRTWAGRIGARYMGADRADEFGTRNGVPGEMVAWLTPAGVVAEADIAD
jgi:PPOX class probable F420-dependent enzyme